MGLISSARDVSFDIARGLGITAGVVNLGQRILLQNLDLQSPSSFEILLYPKMTPAAFSVASGGDADATSKYYKQAALDSLMTRLHIQKIVIPTPKINYEKKTMFGEVDSLKNRRGDKLLINNGQGGAVGVEPPQKVSITFVESDLSTAIRYLNGWFNCVYDQKTGVFEDNQELGKRNGVLIFKTAAGLPSGQTIRMTGLSISSISDFSIGQEESYPLFIEADFFVENVHLYDLYF